MVLSWTSESLRDEFAAHALPACFAVLQQNIQLHAEMLKHLTAAELNAAVCEGVADLAYSVADAMMERRKQKPAADR